MTIHLLTSTKKTFSASEIQRQLGHKRYQPIWEMVHKIRSVMGLRDNTYQLSGSVELDEGYFTSENSDKSQSEKQKVRSYQNADCTRPKIRHYLFNRLMVASVLYRSTFQHRTYGIANASNCG